MLCQINEADVADDMAGRLLEPLSTCRQAVEAQHAKDMRVSTLSGPYIPANKLSVKARPAAGPGLGAPTGVLLPEGCGESSSTPCAEQSLLQVQGLA